MKNKLSVFFVLISILALIAIFFTGCKVEVAEESTAEETKVAETSTEGGAAEKVIIELWSWNNEGDFPNMLAEVEKRFKEDYPNFELKAEFISYADYVVKLKSVIAGGEVPDIVQVPWGGEATDIIKSGVLLQMDDILKENFPKFLDVVYNEKQIVDGHMYTVVFDLNTLQIAYNVDMFKEFGLQIPKTQEELKTLSSVLKEKGKFCIAQGTKDLWTGADTFFAQIVYTDPTHTLLRKADSGEISWDQPEFLLAAQNTIDLIEAGVYAPGANSMDAFIGAKDLFVQQQAAMMYPVGNYITAGLTRDIADAFVYDLFPLPPINTGDKSVCTGGCAYNFGIAKDSDNIDWAVKFLTYFTDNEGKDFLVKNNLIPSSEYTGSVVNEDPLYANMMEAQKDCQSRVVSDPEVYTAILNGMQAIFGQEMTARDFIDSLVAVASK